MKRGNLLIWTLFVCLIASNNGSNSTDSVFNYELNTFDLKISKCKSVLSFNYSSKLEFVSLNDDESNQYIGFTGYGNSFLKIMVAVRNRFELILATINNEVIQNDILIKVIF